MAAKAKVLKIGGHRFTLLLDPMDGDNCGETNYEACEITINANLGKTQKESTLLHEAMHGMNTTINHEFLDSLAEQMYGFLVENGLWNEEGANELLNA